MTQETNRSLWLAVLACLAMYFFAKTIPITSGSWWLSAVFFLATLGLSSWGFKLGLHGVRRWPLPFGWIAPLLNALVFVALLTAMAFWIRNL